MSQRNERSSQPEFNGVTHWLIHHAAHRAPDSLSSRLEEEWLADLESRSAGWSRLRFAAGCCWASLVIVHEFARNRVPATSAVSSGGVVALADRNFSYFSLRSATLFLIAGLHAALFYGMITTLSHTPGSKPPPPRLVNQVLDPVPRVMDPVPRPTIEKWTITVPPLDPVAPPLPPIAPDVTADYDVKPVVHDVLPPRPDTPTHVVSRVTGGPGAGFPETGDFYPPQSIRGDEHGISTVSVCVDPRGRLTSGPTLEKSSGFARLDEAALRLARAGSGHYRANTEDGQPVNSCYPFGIRFQLNK
jgi:periplasmic protein TonB